MPAGSIHFDTTFASINQAVLNSDMGFMGEFHHYLQLKALNKNTTNQYCNLTAEELVSESLKRQQSSLSDTGALCIRTGEFTGRSPEDKFTVDNDMTHDAVDWNKFNKALSTR